MMLLFKKSYVGTVERNQKGIISTWEPVAEGHSLPTCVSQGKRREGLLESDKRCGYRSFQGMSIPRVKPPASQREGRREAREINILNPSPTPCSPSFIQTQVEEKGVGANCSPQTSIPGTQLSGEWSAGANRRYPAEESVGENIIPT